MKKTTSGHYHSQTARLGNERSKCRRGKLSRSEIRREIDEVVRIDVSVGVEVALIPILARSAEIARERVEIDRVHSAVDVRIATIRVAQDELPAGGVVVIA